MYEAQKEEILSLRSIYCGPEECRLVYPHSFEQLEEGSLGPISLVIKLNVPVKLGCVEESCVELSTTFELDESYPGEAPVIKLSSDDLNLGCITNLQEKAVVYARSLRPEPSLFSVLEWLKDSIYETDPSCFILRPHTSDGEYTKTLKQPLSNKSKSTSSHSAKYTTINHKAVQKTVEYSVCIAKIDHMRNEQKYFKILKSWARELSISGRLLNCGRHSVYVLLIGTSGNLSEFLRRWKTQNIDVDSQGKPCKEKLISVLCQQLLNDFLPQWNRYAHVHVLPVCIVVMH